VQVLLGPGVFIRPVGQVIDRKQQNLPQVCRMRGRSVMPPGRALGWTGE